MLPCTDHEKDCELPVFCGVQKSRKCYSAIGQRHQGACLNVSGFGVRCPSIQVSKVKKFLARWMARCRSQFTQFDGARLETVSRGELRALTSQFYSIFHIVYRSKRYLSPSFLNCILIKLDFQTIFILIEKTGLLCLKLSVLP